MLALPELRVELELLTLRLELLLLRVELLLLLPLVLRDTFELLPATLRLELVLELVLLGRSYVEPD